MKRFTLILASLFLSLGALNAQEVYVTYLNDLSNEKTYLIESARCVLINSANVTTGLATTNGTAVGTVAKSIDDPNQQFKIEKDGENYYLRSVGAGKYVTANGAWSDTKGTALTITNVSGENAGYPWKLSLGTNYLNSQASGQTASGIIISSYSTTDPGNCFRIIDIEATKAGIVNITTINAEYNAAKEAAQVVIDRNFASSEKINAVNTALANAETAYNSLTITDGVISLADATAFREKIAAINTAVKDARYLVSTEDLSNNIAFAISTFDRGSWITNGTAITSTQKLGTSADATSPAQQFAFIKSEESGNLYLYSVADAKFVGKNGDYTSLSAEPVQAVTILESTSADFHWVVALVAGESDYKHMGISNGYNPAVITFHNSTSDEGNQSRFEPVTRLDEGTVNAALAKIAEFEAPKIQGNDVFNWTTTTEWTTVGVAAFTSTVMNENNLETISYIEAPITINGPRTATVTFDYTGGDCALNMRGVEVIDAIGNIVAADYHVGKAGTPPATANVYTVSVVEAGTYYVRCYATFDSNNRANATNGTITVAYEEAQEADFSHNVTFAAEYATLYLGYKVAIPTDVEAYVVSGVGQWATLSPVTGVIPAATPVILKNTDDTKTEYTFAYTSEAAAVVENNYLKGSIANRYVAEDAYVLGKLGEVVGLYVAEKNQLDGTAWLNNANKAYLVVPAEQAEGIACYSFRFGEGTTGIDEITDNRVQSTVIYDLTGRRVENISAPGIYIVGGKKVLVK